MANTLRFKRGLVSGIPTAAAGEPLFTTDTFDLYIGNGTGNTRFQKYIASGTTSQLLRGDGSLLTMPIVLTSPSNGQVLKYNGTSWVNGSDAGITGSGVAGQVAYFTGATTQGGSNNLFWDATNIRLGIGTNTPTTTVDIQRSGLNILKLNGGTGTNQGSSLYIQNGNFCVGDTSSFLGGTPNTTFGFYVSSAPLVFYVGSTSERMRLTANGRLLLGTTTEGTQRLQVAGDVKFDADAATNGFYWDNTNKRLGIGTSSPNTLIEAFKTTQAGSNEYLRVSAGSTSGNLSLSIYPSTGQSYGLIGSNLIFLSGGLSRINTSIGGTGIALNKNTIDFYTGSDAGNPTLNMRIDANGSVGIGTTPSAWGSSWRALEFSNGVYLTAFSATATPIMILGANAHFNNTNFIYKVGGIAATRYQQDSGIHYWYNAPSGTAGTNITFTQAMTLHTTGNLAIGGTNDSGERLQVTGTMKVTGASTFGGAITGTSAVFSGALTSAGLISTSNIIVNAGFGILVGGAGFAIAPSATRGIIAINGSGDQLLTFSTQSYI